MGDAIYHMFAPHRPPKPKSTNDAPNYMPQRTDLLQTRSTSLVRSPGRTCAFLQAAHHRNARLVRQESTPSATQPRAATLGNTETAPQARRSSPPPWTPDEWRTRTQKTGGGSHASSDMNLPRVYFLRARKTGSYSPATVWAREDRRCDQCWVNRKPPIRPRSTRPAS